MNRLIRFLPVASLALAASLALPATSHAESLHTKVAQEQGLNLPQRGLSMAQVEQRYGAPLHKLPTRGGDSAKHPPINRWEYPNYIVYFERSHVIHSVITTSDTGAH